MAKLTKAQAKAHAEACRVLEQDRLSEDDRVFVLENWQESATHINSIAGAFFTPWSLARSFAIETASGRVIDLCSGIGALSLATYWRHSASNQNVTEIVCIEKNPEYAAVGAKVLPEARWIVRDVFDLPPNLGWFDCAIGNPPFGSVKRSGRAPRFTGSQFEMHIIDIASDLADWGIFIVPQGSAPFEYSGVPYYRERPSPSHNLLFAQTGVELEPNCGIDTTGSDGEWHGVSIRTEIVLADFRKARSLRGDMDVAPVIKPAPPELGAVDDLPLFAVGAE